MSGAGPTLPHDAPRLEIKSFAVEVVAGPDKSKRVVAERDALTIGSAEGNDLVLSDSTVSRFHLELRRIDGRIALRDNGSTNGTEVGGVLVDAGWIRPGSVVRLGGTRVRVDDAEPVTLDLFASDNFEGVIGRAPGMRRLLADVKQAASSSAPVLLLGETG